MRSVREVANVAAALGLDAAKLEAGLPRERGARAGRAQFVLVQTANGLQPRLVRTGLSDYDHAEVLEGLKPGEEVALLSVAELSAKRRDRQAQMARRVGTGLTGGNSSTATDRGSSGGGR